MDVALFLLGAFHDGVEFVEGAVFFALLDEAVGEEEDADGAALLGEAYVVGAVGGRFVFADGDEELFDVVQFARDAFLLERFFDFGAAQDFADGACRDA